MSNKPKLNQIIAVEKGVKSSTESRITRITRTMNKPELLQGLARSYQARDDEGEQLPGESKLVQVRVKEELKQLHEALSELFDTTATKEWANQQAKADVAIDGVVLVAGAPVSYLLFLEKQLAQLMDIARALPTLDPSDKWGWDPNTDAYATEPIKTTRTKKIPRNHVKAEATEHHPAQVEVFQEDVIVGTWNTIKFSGALPAIEVKAMVQRVEKLQRAVQFAREEANSMEIERQKVAAKVLDYILGA
jgi:hypothetical protein